MSPILERVFASDRAMMGGRNLIRGVASTQGGQPLMNGQIVSFTRNPPGAEEIFRRRSRIVVQVARVVFDGPGRTIPQIPANIRLPHHISLGFP